MRAGHDAADEDQADECEAPDVAAHRGALLGRDFDKDEERQRQQYA